MDFSHNWRDNYLTCSRQRPVRKENKKRRGRRSNGLEDKPGQGIPPIVTVMGKDRPSLIQGPCSYSMWDFQPKKHGQDRLGQPHHSSLSSPNRSAYQLTANQPACYHHGIWPRTGARTAQSSETSVLWCSPHVPPKWPNRGPPVAPSGGLFF